MKVLIATSTTDFDPTEVAVPWKILREAGIEVCFATDTGLAGYADKRMLDGNRLGLLKPALIADSSARDAYAEMRLDPAFKQPISLMIQLQKAPMHHHSSKRYKQYLSFYQLQRQQADDLE